MTAGRGGDTPQSSARPGTVAPETGTQASGTRAPAPPVERLRVGGRTIVAVVAVVIATSVLVNVVSAASRVLGWLVAAALLAGLLHPLVARIGRLLPRGLAALTVLLAVIGILALAGYSLVDELGREFHRIERAAPAAAERIEQSRRFGSAAREFRLAQRTREFIDELPARLQGGSGADLLRTNATRSVAFLAGGVLTAFLLLHGERLVGSALAQIDDERRRRRAGRVLSRAYVRARTYVTGRLVMSAVVASFSGTAAWIGDLPGARVLGLFAGVWSLVPTVGLLIGSLPIVVMAGGSPGGWTSFWMLVVFVAAQIAEAWAFRRAVELRSVQVGPFVSLVAGMAGFELYGIGGALAALSIAVLGLAVADELAPTDEDQVDLSPLTGT